MCIAVPGKIKKIEGRKAVVQYDNEQRVALISDDPVKIGDYVMVQMGIVVKILSATEAKSAINAWKSNK